MSIIPQRPPDTPLMQFFSTGKYSKPVPNANFKPSAAEPGNAARMNQRNLQPHDEINVKAVTQTRFSKRHYRPDKYLKPEEGVMKIDSHAADNNLTRNKVNNMKKDIETNRKIQQNNFGAPSNEFNVAKCMDKTNFEKQRNKQLNSKRSTHGQMRPSRGKEIAEVMLRRVGDENDYYNNKKHTFMTGSTQGNYQKTTPEYFRILDKPQNKVDPCSSKGFDGTMTIISKNQGWITVTPKNKNRKKPVEKFGVSGDAAKTSKLTPNWMQCQYPKNTTDNMRSVVPNTMNLKKEQNRTYLVDKEQPKKSIWSIGAVRHNVHTNEDAQTFNNQAQSNNIVRMMEWKENSSKQGFDKKVAGKIGSYHG